MLNTMHTYHSIESLGTPATATENWLNADKVLPDGSTPSPELLATLEARRLRIAEHLREVVKNQPCAQLSVAAQFLAQFESPKYFQVVAPKGVKHRHLTDELMTELKLGMVGRLNGEDGYRPVRTGENLRGAFTAFKEQNVSSHIKSFQSFTIESDGWLSGEVFKGSDGRTATFEGIKLLAGILRAAGCEDLVNLVMSSGGKSIHTHMVTSGTADRATHEELAIQVGGYAHLCFAAAGVTVDNAPLRATQPVRIPIGEVYGRNQEVYFFQGVSHTTPEEYLKRLKLHAGVVAAELKVVAELAYHMTTVSLKASDSMRKRDVDLLLKLRAQAAHYAGKSLDLQKKMTREERTRAKSNLSAYGKNTEIRYNPVKGTCSFSEPLDPSLLTHSVRGMPELHDLDTVSVEELHAAYFRRAALGHACPKVQNAAFSADGLDDEHPSCLAFWDAARGHALTYDSRVGAYYPLVPSVGTPCLDVWARGKTLTPFVMDTFSPAPGLNVVCAHPGAGKTTAFVRNVRELLAAKPDAKIVYVAPNRALAAQVTADFNRLGVAVQHYSDTSREMSALTGRWQVPLPKGTVYVTTVHSLKWVASCEKVDLFVYDEISTGSSMVATVDDDGNKGVWQNTAQAREAYRTMLALMKSAEKVVLIEAIPTWAFFSFIDAVVEEAERPVTVYTTNAFIGEGKTVDIIKHSLSIKSAVEDIKAGKRVLVQVANLKTAKILAQELTSALPDKEQAGAILVVTARTIHMPVVQAILGNNGKAARKYKAVVATTSLASGVSFVDVFDTNYVFLGPHISAHTCAQSLSRDRTAPSIKFVRARCMHKTTADSDAKADSIATDTFLGRVRRAVVTEEALTSVSDEQIINYARAQGFTVREGNEVVFDILKARDPSMPSTLEEAMTAPKGGKRAKDGKLMRLSPFDRALRKAEADFYATLARYDATQLQKATSVVVREPNDYIDDSVIRRYEALAAHTPLLHSAVTWLNKTAFSYESVYMAYAHRPDSNKYNNSDHAEFGWRALIHGDDSDFAASRSWLAAAALLSECFGVYIGDLGGQVVSISRRASPHRDNERWLLLNLKLDRVSAVGKRLNSLVYQDRAGKALSEQDARIVGWLKDLRIVRSGKASILRDLLRGVLGVPVTGSRLTSQNLMAVSIHAGHAAVAAKLILHSWLKDDKGYMYSKVMDAAGMSSALEDLTGCSTLGTHEPVILRDVASATMREVGDAMGARISGGKHFVRERDGSITWMAAAATPLNSERCRRQGIALGDVSGDAIRFPVHESVDSYIAAALAYKVPVFCMTKGCVEWVDEAAVPAEKKATLNRNTRAWREAEGRGGQPPDPVVLS